MKLFHRCSNHLDKNGKCTVCGKDFHKCTDHLDKNCTCTVCGKTDFHKFDKNGSCTVCGKKCFHKLDQNGFCTVCGKDLHMCRNHLDTNGVCRVCGKKTHMCKDHLNANSVCTVCGKKYHKCSDHLDTNCTCTVCGKKGLHKPDKNGVCTVCGKKIENRTSPEPHSHYYITVETRKIYASCEWANDRCTGRCCEHYSESSTAKKQQCIVCDKAFWLIDDRKVSDYEAKILFESQCSDWGHSWVNGRCETCGEVRKQDS